MRLTYVDETYGEVRFRFGDSGESGRDESAQLGARRGRSPLEFPAVPRYATFWGNCLMIPSLSMSAIF
jgi:hypothetical protein